MESKKTPRRVTRSNQNTNKYLCKPKSAKGKDNSPILKRGQYFHTFRSERTALAICENSYMASSSTQEYRANRYIYYCVLPFLAKYLWYEPDRVRLKTLEKDVYNQLLSQKFATLRSNREPNRVRIWDTRSTGTIVPVS